MRMLSIRIWFSHCFLLLIPLLALAETHVGGPESGVWTPDGNPYWVDSTVVVEPGNSLTIMNGVEIFFTGLDYIEVYGELMVEGVNGDSVFFRSYGTPVWGGIWFFTGSSPLSTIKFAHIEKPVRGIRAHHSSPKISNCFIIAQSYGVWGYYSNFLLQDSKITVDTGEMAGIYLQSSDAQILGCEIFAGNLEASYTAVGIQGFDSDPDVYDSEIHVDNSGLSFGLWLQDVDKGDFRYNLIYVVSKTRSYGMFLNHSSYPYSINNTIVVKSGSEVDRCIYLYDNSNPWIENCIIYGDGSSQGLVAEENCRPNVIYNDFYNHNLNQALIGCNAGVGCIFEDPLFANPGNAIFKLTPNSPCIDAGNPNSPPDPDQTRADMGCYYYDYINAQPISNLSKPSSFSLIEAFPNPFNAFTTLQIVLPESVVGRLAIYNQRGRLVHTIKSGVFPAGPQRFTWDAASYGSGTYWVVMRADEHILTHPLILIK